MYLLGTGTPYFLDWSDNVSAGFSVVTNTVLGTVGWGTNSDLTSAAYLNANYFRVEVTTNDTTTSGNLFFLLSGP
jgi:hypothetical protein